MKRRNFLISPSALALGAAAGSIAPSLALAAPAIITPQSRILPRQGKGPRIVICGGGWGGMTAARYLRDLIPNADVVLLERNPTFWSGPMSNKWLIDIVGTDFVNRDMLRPANTYGYQLLQTEVTGFERDKKLVHTSHGLIEYDFLILSGGIRNDYEAWFGNDQRAIDYTRKHFPNAYIPNQEMFALKQKVKDFKGGTLVMTLPPPPHRCPPSPYERACLIAWHIKKNKIPGKILILDPKPKIGPIGAGYKQAFEELYPDIITHVPNARVQEVDPFNKRIKTAAGEFKFDDAAPPSGRDGLARRPDRQRRHRQTHRLGRHESAPVHGQQRRPGLLCWRPDGHDFRPVRPLPQERPRGQLHRPHRGQEHCPARIRQRGDTAVARQPVLHDGQRRSAGRNFGQVRVRAGRHRQGHPDPN